MTTQTAKNTLAKTGANQVEKRKEKNIYDLVKESHKQFQMALPKHMDTDRFVRISITALRNNPKLLQCESMSLLGALMTSAQLGLEPGGVLGQCYLIPYGRQCQFQLGYKGMVELLRRSGQLSDIYAYPVYENDEFSIEYGLDRKLTHKPNFKDKGEVVGYYSVAILKDGARAFEYMTVEEVKEHEKKHRKGNTKNDVWTKFFDEMAMKTVAKKMLKWLPISVEMIENLRREDQKATYDPMTNEVEYKEPTYEDAQIVDTETGEIIEEPKEDFGVEDLQNLFTE